MNTKNKAVDVEFDLPRSNLNSYQYRARVKIDYIDQNDLNEQLTDLQKDYPGAVIVSE